MKSPSDKCENPWTCSLLGFFLPVVGLIVSAIIGKGAGVKHCLGGIGLRYAIAILPAVYLTHRIRSEPPIPKEVHEAMQPPQEWQVSFTTDKMTDERITIAYINAREKISGKRPSLTFRVRGNERDTFITYPQYIGKDQKITIRFDKDDAITDTWTVSEDGRALFSPFPFDDFLALTAESQTLLVRLDGETFSFDLPIPAGIKNILLKH